MWKLAEETGIPASESHSDSSFLYPFANLPQDDYCTLLDCTKCGENIVHTACAANKKPFAARNKTAGHVAKVAKDRLSGYACPQLGCSGCIQKTLVLRKGEKKTPKSQPVCTFPCSHQSNVVAESGQNFFPVALCADCST